MKCLTLILTIALMLLPYPLSVEGRNLDLTFTKICGFDYMGKIQEVCGHWPQTSRYLYRHGNSQVLYDDDTLKKMNMKKDQLVLDKGSIQQLKSDYEQKLFDNDHSQNEWMAADYNEFVSESERDNTMQPAITSRISKSKLSWMRLHNLCCFNSCTVRDILKVCGS